MRRLRPLLRILEAATLQKCQLTPEKESHPMQVLHGRAKRDLGA
jgi:hypothetical protein